MDLCYNDEDGAWMDESNVLSSPFSFHIDNETHHCLKRDIKIRKTLVFSPFSLSLGLLLFIVVVYYHRVVVAGFSFIGSYCGVVSKREKLSSSFNLVEEVGSG
jgi:hypothetical protein